MAEIDGDGERATKLREIVASALEILERVDDPAPSDVDLTEIALLLDQALELLIEPIDEIASAMKKSNAAIDALDIRLASIETRTAAIIDLRQILRQRNATGDATEPSDQAP